MDFFGWVSYWLHFVDKKYLIALTILDIVIAAYVYRTGLKNAVVGFLLNRPRDLKPTHPLYHFPWLIDLALLIIFSGATITAWMATAFFATGDPGYFRNEVGRKIGGTVMFISNVYLVAENAARFWILTHWGRWNDGDR